MGAKAMRTIITPHCVKLWLSARDTSEWANRPGESWPGSQLAGRRVFAEFDRNGLCDLAIDGRSQDCDAGEFNAITSDFLRDKLPENHALHFVTVGQFSTP